MSSIHQLPDKVINTIAAGEVVERPVSVVKELVENALDAGANKIQIFVEEGGNRLLRVVDNGRGIAKEDLANTFKLHFTSKINSLDDLLNIKSMGFRGEALASIAAVSSLVIRSRVKGSEHGWELTAGEDASDPSPVGMPVGTEIVVKNLFYNVPARSKFLKSASTEFAHIADYVEQVAYINKDCSFVLYKDGKEYFDSSSGHASTRSLLAQIVGKDLVEKMLSVSASHPQLEVRGVVGAPGTGVSRRPRQFVFVNSRPVDDKTIRAAINRAYASLLGRQERAQFLLEVEIAPHLVDFNVHPQKREVRFVDTNLVFQLVHQAVATALQSYAPFAPTAVESSYAPTNSGYSTYDRPAIDLSSFGEPVAFQSVHQSFVPSTEPVKGFDFHVKPKRFQMHNVFIFEELPDGVMVYDQHALHERVMYEKFCSVYLEEKDKSMAQPLLTPQKIELSNEEASVAEENISFLTGIGFSMALTGRLLEVTQVPAVLSDNNIERVVREYLDDIAQNEETDSEHIQEIDDQTHRRLAYLACRSAIKAGDSLSQLEIDKLVEQYHATATRFTCPHGRPVQVMFTKAEIERWFKR